MVRATLMALTLYSTFQAFHQAVFSLPIGLIFRVKFHLSGCTRGGGGGGLIEENQKRQTREKCVYFLAV